MKYSVLLLPCCLLLAVSCTSAPDVSPSGFLNNYSQLGPDLNRFDSAATYLSPTADFKAYDSILISQTQVSLPGGGTPSEDVQKLAAYFDSALSRELGKDYKIVSAAGPNTIRLRTSLGGPATVGSDLMAFVKTAQIEGELVDSQDNSRLVAISDKPLEDLNPNDTLSSAADVKALLDTAAVRYRLGLTDLRARILTTN